MSKPKKHPVVYALSVIEQPDEATIISRTDLVSASLDTVRTRLEALKAQFAADYEDMQWCFEESYDHLIKRSDTCCYTGWLPSPSGNYIVILSIEETWLA